MMQVARNTMLTTSWMALCLGSMSAQAQPASAPAKDEAAVEIEQIVVTARRREEALQSVPVAVTVLTPETLRKQNIQRFDEIRFATPALQITPTGQGAYVPGFTIRSQRQQDGILTADASVAVYLNEVVQARPHGISQSLYDVQSIQVLKGPQGTLFGKNSTGGAILFSTRKPTDHFEGEVAVGAGNYDLREATAVLNVPVADGFALRFAANRVERDGFTTNILTGAGSNDRDDWGFRISALLNRGNIENLTIWDDFRTDNGGTGVTLAAARPTGRATTTYAPPRTVTLGVPNFADAFARQRQRSIFDIERDFDTFADIHNWGVTDILTWDTGSVTLKNIVAYRSVDLKNLLEFDGTTADVLHSTIYQDTDQISNEFQLQGETSRLKWIAGAYYFREKGTEWSEAFTLSPVNTNNPFFTGGDAKNVSKSLFAQGTAALNGVAEGLSLTAGVRYTWDERSMNIDRAVDQVGCRLTDAQGVRLPLSACSRSVSKNFNEPTWTVSLDYQLTDDKLIYLAHRKGYRSGGFVNRAETLQQFEPFEPETVKDVELGLKADWRLGDALLRTNLAGYYQWYSDIQRANTVISPSGALASVIQNAASARISGGEAELTFIPTSWLELSGYFAYSDARYRKFLALDPVTRNTIDQSHLKFAAAPERVSAATVRVTLLRNDRIGTISANARYYHQSSFYLSDNNEPEGLFPGYDLVNAGLNWDEIRRLPVDVSLYVKNIADKHYFVSGTTLQSNLGFTTGYPGEPRTYGMTLRVRFGQ